MRRILSQRFQVRGMRRWVLSGPSFVSPETLRHINRQDGKRGDRRYAH